MTTCTHRSGTPPGWRRSPRRGTTRSGTILPDYRQADFKPRTRGAGPRPWLSITHTIEREPSKFIEEVSGGWPKVISNLKSLLETGSAVLHDPYPN